MDTDEHKWVSSVERQDYAARQQWVGLRLDPFRVSSGFRLTSKSSQHRFDVPDGISQGVGVLSRSIAFQRGIVVGIETAIEPEVLKLLDDLEHIHVAIVEQHFLETSCGGETATKITEMYFEDASFATVVVDLVEDERKAGGFASCPTTIEIADTGLRKRVDDAVETEATE